MTTFAGLRVLDLSRVLAGPYCGQLLADFGAEVIKIEAPSGDENRYWEPVVAGQSANFGSVNHSKMGMTLNLKAAEGQDILQALIQQSDVLIDSFLPETAVSLGLDHATVSERNDRLIHLSIGGYGGQGPLMNRPGYDLTLQAFTGMMSITGERDGPPLRSGASIIDMATGMMGFAGVASALFARERDGKGQHVQVSLMETGLALMGYHLTAFTMAGKLPSKEGSGVWHIVPYQAFRTADGWILAGATNDAAWRRLCRCLGAENLGADPTYATAAGRIAHRDTIVATLGDIFVARPTEEWISALVAGNVPCAPINTVDHVADHPQVHAMEMLPEVRDATGNAIRVPGTPLKMSLTPAGGYRMPPMLGEHTDALLQNLLGIDGAKIDDLRARGVL